MRRDRQELLEHKDVSTTMIYTHVLNRGGKEVRSPADALTQGLGHLPAADPQPCQAQDFHKENVRLDVATGCHYTHKYALRMG